MPGTWKVKAKNEGKDKNQQTGKNGQEGGACLEQPERRGNISTSGYGYGWRRYPGDPGRHATLSLRGQGGEMYTQGGGGRLPCRETFCEMLASYLTNSGGHRITGGYSDITDHQRKVALRVKSQQRTERGLFQPCSMA